MHLNQPQHFFLLLSVLFYFLYSNSGCTLCTTGCPDLCTFRMCNVNSLWCVVERERESSVMAWNGMARQHVCLQERARAERRDIPASLIVYNLMGHHEYWCAVAIHAFSAFESSHVPLRWHTYKLCLSCMHATVVFWAFPVPLRLFLQKDARGKAAWHVSGIQMRHSKSQGWIRMWNGPLCNHSVMEPERDKAVPNKHNPRALGSGGAAACACLPRFWKMREKQSVCRC